jgi:hypothetical protein
MMRAFPHQLLTKMEAEGPRGGIDEAGYPSLVAGTFRVFRGCCFLRRRDRLA